MRYFSTRMMSFQLTKHGGIYSRLVARYITGSSSTDIQVAGKRRTPSFTVLRSFGDSRTRNRSQSPNPNPRPCSRRNQLWSSPRQSFFVPRIADALCWNLSTSGGSDEFQTTIANATLRNRCAFAKCKEVAVRFFDVGPDRRWLCAQHFEIEKETKNGSKEIVASS
jgi:hypothetical protein